jgi:alpha-glucosidase (family GH31 glycosyl hydrolase)
LLVGSDICGFNGATNEELCARWIEVGAFYPFSRNHNAIGQPSQELYQWNSVTVASQNALAIRYQLLPYLYSLFHFANQRGETVIRSLWMNFPTDVTTLSIERQFMWGNGVLLSPVLDAGVTSVNAYFPKQL